MLHSFSVLNLLWSGELNPPALSPASILLILPSSSVCLGDYLQQIP
jgi:hypothetical protein